MTLENNTMVEKTIPYIKIESPLSNFNNLIVQLSDEIEQIYYPDNSSGLNQLLVKNQLIFDTDSILLFGFIKIFDKSSEISFKFNGDINFNNLELVEVTLQNKDKLISIFNRYIFIMSQMLPNYDDSVSQRFVESIYNIVMSNKLNENTSHFLVPYKRKIQHLLDNDKTLETLFTRYEYVISFSRNKDTIHFSLMRVLSSLLDESKSLDNIRYLEKETIKNGTINTFKFPNFLKELFYYGELCI